MSVLKSDTVKGAPAMFEKKKNKNKNIFFAEYLLATASVI